MIFIYIVHPVPSSYIPLLIRTSHSWWFLCLITGWRKLTSRYISEKKILTRWSTLKSKYDRTNSVRLWYRWIVLPFQSYLRCFIFFANLNEWYNATKLVKLFHIWVKKYQGWLLPLYTAIHKIVAHWELVDKVNAAEQWS